MDEIKAEVMKQAAKWNLSILSIEEDTIRAEACCYRCYDCFAVSVPWECPNEEDWEGAITLDIENALDKVAEAVQDMLCDSCADEEAREYDRQVTSDYYHDRL